MPHDHSARHAHADERHAHQGHAHAHDGHAHAPPVGTDNERKVLFAFVVIFAFMLVEVAGGVLSGSLALLADAGHMLTDAAALALAYLAFRFGRRAADARRTFGYARFEVVAGFVNAITLFAIVVWIVFEAVQRFRHPVEILSGPMLAVAVAGLLVNVFVLWLLTRGDTDHVNIRGAALHVMGDLLGSVGAVAAALVVRVTGWTPIDPILSVLVSALILRSAWNLLSKSLHILLEGAPDNAAPQDIARRLTEAVPGVAAVSHVHVWLITSGRPLATLHVRPEAGADPRRVVRAVEAELRAHFGVDHATVAIDWPQEDDGEGEGDGEGNCSLSGPASGCDGHPHAAGEGR